MLVATTVIEVGVDVPNATVMVVEDADRFGLLQLHQLRGRIGRGAHASRCYLLADPTTPHGEARMAAMVESGDGFELAERDLAIRGAGEVFGERQAGWSDLKLGRLPTRRTHRHRRARGGRAHPRRRPRPRSPRAVARRGRRPPRRRRRVPLQELMARGLRVVAGAVGGLHLVAPKGRGRRPIARRKRCSRRSAASSTTRSCSISTLAAARSGSRRCRGAQPEPCSSTATATRSTRSGRTSPPLGSPINPACRARRRRPSCANLHQKRRSTSCCSILPTTRPSPTPPRS